MGTTNLLKQVGRTLLVAGFLHLCAGFDGEFAFAGRIIFADPQPIVEGTIVGGGAVAAIDLNDDLSLDLLVGFVSLDSNVDTIAWLQNNSTRNHLSFFYQTLPFGFSESVQSLAPGDLDGDGDMDFAMGTLGVFGGSFDWYENDGSISPVFTHHELFSGWTPSVAGADFDGDGDLDLLSCQFNGDLISWYENNPLAPGRFVRRTITTDPDGFGPLEGFPDGVVGLTTGDLDGDGDIDIASASERDNTIAWYENDGSSPPSFIPKEISTSALGARDIVAADLDGDGDLDLVASSLFDDKIAWHENSGGKPPSWSEHTIVEDPDGPTGPLNGFTDMPWKVVAVDLDGDGDIDLLSSSAPRGDSRVAWYENSGGISPTFRPRTVSTSVEDPDRPIAVDVDMDGDLDLVVGSTRSSSLSHALILWIENRATLPHSKGGRHWKKLATR